MATRAILITRKLIPVEIVSGGFLDFTAFDGVWPFMGVDYGNIGSESDPPTLAYVNIVDNSETGHAASALGKRLGVLLPLSAESQEVVASGGVVLPQFRRPIAYQATKKLT